jgi:hypothetical protein
LALNLFTLPFKFLLTCELFFPTALLGRFPFLSKRFGPGAGFLGRFLTLFQLLGAYFRQHFEGFGKHLAKGCRLRKRPESSAGKFGLEFLPGLQPKFDTGTIGPEHFSAVR